MKKRFLAKMLVFMTVGVLSLGTFGCGKQDTPAEIPNDTPVATEPAEDEKEEEPGDDQFLVTDEDEGEEVQEEPVDPHEGKAMNLLTGEWISKKEAKKRPLAVMIGNTIDALPQYGIGQADVLYEIPVEGAITRLMAIFSDYSKLDSLGSIRSCRLYFAETAAEYDALYVHFGQASNAKSYLASDAIDNINGIDGNVYSLSFYRESSRKAPHNAFTNSDGIAKAIEKLKYDDKYDKDYEGHFKFEDPLTETASTISTAKTKKAYGMQTGFSHSATYFTYDKKAKKYLRYQYRKAHVDGSDGEQLCFDNVLFLYMDMKVIDKSGHLQITNTGTGTGVYFADGKWTDMTWSKGKTDDYAIFCDADGNELVLKTGKTCICVIDSSNKDKVKIFDTEDAFNAR